MWPWSKTKAGSKEEVLVVAVDLQDGLRQELEFCAEALGLQVTSQAPSKGPYVLVLAENAQAPPDIGEQVVIVRAGVGDLQRHLREALLYARAARGFSR